MNPPSDAVPGTAAGAPAAPALLLRETRPLYWSVRRELWENRFLTIAPVVVAAAALFGALLSLIGLPRRIESLSALDPAGQHAATAGALSWAPAPVMMATLLVGVFYALEALHGERRDRSILFWKSLPVSDRTTVLSKACIPLVVLPAIGYVLSVITFVVLQLAGTLVLAGSGVSPSPLWAEARAIQMPLVMLYGLTVHALWYAPVYGWLLMISAWARRMPVLWAGLPPLALIAMERMAFGTSHVGRFLAYRVSGAMTEAFDMRPKEGVRGLAQLDPAGFLSAPGLWLGLIVAAGCLAAAARLRRDREPM